MPVFQVSSRSVQVAAPPKKKPRHLRREWLAVINFVLAVSGAAGLFALSLIIFGNGNNNALFILLPVLVYLAVTQFQRYNLKIPVFVFNLFLNSTPLYLLLTLCLAFIYYGTITELELLTHPDPTISHIILVTTALTWTIILDPVRVYFQQRIERRFNVRNRKMLKAIGVFTSTLREEIDLEQLRERFLTVIQQTMQPYSVSLWIRTSHESQEQSDSMEQIRVADDDPLMIYMLSHPIALEIDRLHLDSPILQVLKLDGAELLLPLASQGELLGLLILGPHLKGEDYTSQERSMLDTLAPQVAPALRVAQLVQEQKVQVRERERMEQEQVREHERIEQELRTAQTIQRTFLPKDVPVLPGWQLLSYYQPAREVGGDFYDFLPFEDGRLGLVIGDVSGKGIPAALLMTATRTMLRTAALEKATPGEVLARVNDLLYADIPSGIFVTCFYAILDRKSGKLHYANAGHELPYHQHNGSVTELWATGMPLGMMSGTCYQEYEIILAPGESLLFYSDGLVEAHNAQREMLGFPRLMALVVEYSAGPGLIDSLLKELATFTGGEEQEDDITMVALHRGSCPSAEGAMTGEAGCMSPPSGMDGCYRNVLYPP